MNKTIKTQIKMNKIKKNMINERKQKKNIRKKFMNTK